MRKVNTDILFFLAYFPFLWKENRLMRAKCFVCLYVLLTLNQWVDFHKIWFESYALGSHHNVFLFNFLQSVREMWLMCEVVKWKQH
jgi:hypothetical protein